MGNHIYQHQVTYISEIYPHILRYIYISDIWGTDIYQHSKNTSDIYKHRVKYIYMRDIGKITEGHRILFGNKKVFSWSQTKKAAH